ncbi:MAG: hypothetical protein OXC10_20980 [Rhodospirillaceae bacterium]|nr:hypothetical protein [Rhodospirillaceae bacterium]
MTDGRDKDGGKVPGRRYMQNDWTLNWGGAPEGRRPFFRVVFGEPQDGGRWHDFPGLACCDWGPGTGAPELDGDEPTRRKAIAAKCWSIIDTDSEIALDMVQAALRSLDLELVRTARIARRDDPDERDENA